MEFAIQAKIHCTFSYDLASHPFRVKIQGAIQLTAMPSSQHKLTQLPMNDAGVHRFKNRNQVAP
jgi:hypothetical protein